MARAVPDLRAKSGPLLHSPWRRRSWQSVASLTLWRTRSRALAKDGASIWVLGGPNETALAKQIAATGGNSVRDLTSSDLRNAILAMAAADIAVTNDSGLMHVSAAIGTPTIAIFGPTSPWHWKPLNPIAAIIEPPGDEEARARARTDGNDAVRNRRTDDVAVETVLAAVRNVFADGKNTRNK